MANPIRLVTGQPRAAAGTSPERAALAEAITVLRSRETVATALRTAAADAKETVWAFDARHRTALAAIDKAKADVAEHQIATALGTAGTPPTSIKEARLALADLDDEASIARLTLDGLQARVAEAESAVTFARLTVDHARAAVIVAAPETAAAIAEVERTQRAYVRAGTALRRLARNDALNLSVWNPSGQSAAQLMLMRIESPMTSWMKLLEDPALDGGGEWSRALNELLNDASAPLPAARAE